MLRLTLATVFSLIFGISLISACSSSPQASTDARAEGDAKDSNPVDANISGEVLARERCAGCHGASYAGQGAGGGCPATSIADLAARGWSRGQILSTLRTGLSRDEESLCERMPRFSTQQLSDEDAERIADFLLSL